MSSILAPDVTAEALASFSARCKESLALVRRGIAERFYRELCAQRLTPVGGWVLLFDEKPFAWTLDLDHDTGPRRYLPGVIAVPVHPSGDWFVASGGGSGRGADRWDSLK